MATSADNAHSKEDYLILRAKETLSTDICAAKSWLITAKLLFPHSTKVKFEAYRLEKLASNVKAAAECFSELFQNCPNDDDIWKEIESITASLRSERLEGEAALLCQMFHHIPQDVQHRLLIMTADQSEDPMEHCKLLLLLLKRFPATASTHGPKLVETLLAAEKHNHPGRALNDFRELLACEALPIVCSAPVELHPRLSLRLLNKTIEFYLAYIQQPHNQGNKISQPWNRMFQIVELLGKQLRWELSSLFSTPWNREIYSERLQQFALKFGDKIHEEIFVRQLLICSVIVLIRILDEHNSLMKNGDIVYCLVEAFEEPLLNAAKPKKRKRDENVSIVVTSDGDYNGNGLALAVKLWDVLHKNDYMQHEIVKFRQQLHLDVWLNSFLTEYTIYKGLHHDVYQRLMMENDNFYTYLRLASTSFVLKDYKGMLDYISLVATNLPANRGTVSTILTVQAKRHLHYLPMARFPVLQYCCKLLLSAMQDKFTIPGAVGDYAIGNALVLMQIDWPQEVNLFGLVLERILSRGAFVYPLFQNYVICVDILEELSYLWTENGGGIPLDITNNPVIMPSTARRISTRGADKGVREEIKQIMRRQAARDGIDLLDELVQRFILNEKAALLHSMMLQ